MHPTWFFWLHIHQKSGPAFWGELWIMLTLTLSRPLWLWYFTIRKQHGFWLWSGCEEETFGPMSILETKKKKSLSHKLITFLESTTVSHTMNLSMRKYWLTLNTKMTSYMFKESPGHSRTSLSFVLFPVSTNSICILWHPEFSNSRQPEPLFSPDCHILPSRRKVREPNSKDPSIFDLYGLRHWSRNRPCQWLWVTIFRSS